MWMIRPYVVREITIDLPDVFVESLGVGAEVLARYLTDLAEAGVEDPANHPPPLPVLCRICERQITPWWFEKHTELCLLEHKAEMEVQVAHENLTDHRNAIVRVLDALEVRSRQSRPATSGELAPPAPPLPEYKGLPIGPLSSPSSGSGSGRSSPASPPPRSRDRSTSGLSHSRARSFAVRRPVARIIELVLDLCDTALEINTPALKETRGMLTGEFRTQSPQSENRISQVLQWQSPAATSVEHESGLSAICEDTSKLARAKVDAVFRHRRILEYSERIRVEFEVLVQECITAAMEKTARIAAGELSDSSEDTANTPQDRSESLAEEPEHEESQDSTAEEGVFQGSFDPPSAMAMALRNVSDPVLTRSHSDRRTSSTATSTRSSSPRGTQTPRSHGTTSIPPLSKRGSIALESDTGAESDSSQLSSAISAARRAESPSSELSLHRVASSRERKRKSLILPSVMTSRGHSPARSMPPPSSPLRVARNRLPSGDGGSQSPVTSPVLSTSEFSSPAISAHHLPKHRRESSAASSQVLGPPLSPRLLPVSSNIQPPAQKPSIKDFEIIKPISKGAFGSVYLAKKKSTSEYFAIKVLKRAEMQAKNLGKNVKAERAIMMWQGESDFVAKLYYTFASKDYLYLVMEYLNGGDCASLIKVLGGLQEDWAKKYLAEVVLGVEHLHSRNIVHRDLKPDNLLIDQKGHLKLTDFGLSRMGLRDRQKRALHPKPDEPPVPDLLKQGPFHRAVSVTSSRSTSFDLQGGSSPQQTPSLTPALTGDFAQPSYFSLSREPIRQNSGRSDSETSDGLQSMLRKFSLMDDGQSRSPIEEETGSEDANSPDPYALQLIISHASTVKTGTPPAPTTTPPPALPLFDPQDTVRKFVGTPDYLAPETINGVGQDELSDWWSLGCIMFEFLYGYPPFHGETPDAVFDNILARKIDWPPEDACSVSPEAKDLMNKLMCVDPESRLGANAEDKYVSGGEEIRHHPWFADIHWETLREDQASFVPAPENPEDTEYFDSRGATLQNFASEFEDQGQSSAGTPGADYPERPHDALSRVRSQFNSIKRGLIPLHIPPHVRDGRSRRLSEPMATDDFGTFSFKNLPVLEKANKDVIQKLRAEAMQAQSKPISTLASPVVSSPTPSLESSPMLNMPLKRTMSTSKAPQRPASPLTFTQPNCSPNRPSQPSSPLLVQFSTGQSQERRKTSSGSSSLSQQSSASLQPGNFFDAPRLPNFPTSLKAGSSASSPIKLAKSPGAPTTSHERSLSTTRSSSTLGKMGSPRTRSHTLSSQDDHDTLHAMMPKEHKRRSQVLDGSPSSSDNEDTRQKALLRVQRRRQSSRRLSQFTLAEGPIFRPLDVLVCEDHPVSKLVMEKLLEKLRCRTITATDGQEAARYAMSDVKFDIILMEFRLPNINGADVSRLIRETKNANSHTPIVCVTGYLKELPPKNHFDGLIEKPPTINKLTEILSRFCQWKPPPPGWQPTPYPVMPFSALRQESVKSEESPISVSSSYGAAIPSSSYRGGSSREDSISSSFLGDNDSTMQDMDIKAVKKFSGSWQGDLVQAFDGLGISGDSPEDIEPKPHNQAVFRAAHFAPLRHEESAPPVLEHIPVAVPTKESSAERLAAKRRSQERPRHDSAESGDDEDEELGNVQIRSRSPRNRPRGSSKLGTEMLRTNSRGSVVSVEEITPEDKLSKSPPPAITEKPQTEDVEALAEQVESVKLEEEAQQGTLTPPEIFPRLPGEHSEDVDMEPAEATTPRPALSKASSDSDTNPSPDPDPTPRPSVMSDPLAAAAPLQDSPTQHKGEFVQSPPSL